MSQNSSTLNFNISERVSHSIINNVIFWKYVTRPFRRIYVNCSNRLIFLAVVNTKSQTMHFFLDKLRTMIQEGNMETRQMIPFFSSTFSVLNACNIHFRIWKYSKFIFIFLLSILVCKIPTFLAKSYRFGQFIILFKKVHPLRGVCTPYNMFCPPTGAKYPFF